jgi:ATP-dependent DNA ligase
MLAECFWIRGEHVYEIWPGIDMRLALWHGRCDPRDIKTMFEMALTDGHEGLVIDQTWKLKPTRTYDVVVEGYSMGRPGTRFEGLVGALVTSKGKVSAGLTDEQRVPGVIPIGSLVEIECMQLLPSGKFRHGRFERVRDDKPVSEADT